MPIYKYSANVVIALAFLLSSCANDEADEQTLDVSSIQLITEETGSLAESDASLKSSEEKIGNISIDSLRNVGLVVEPVSYKITRSITQYFRKQPIEVKLVASVNKNDWGKVDSILFRYEKKLHTIPPLEFFTSAKGLMDANHQLSRIKFEDFNFDNYADVAVYNSGSGMKNVLEDIFLYAPVKRQFIYHKTLSESSNISIDTVSKTLSTFAAMGDASRIYGAAKYTWNGKELMKIEEEQQHFDSSLERYIRETKTFNGTGWQVNFDTLTYEKAGG